MSRFLEIAESLMRRPTAPYVEHAILEVIDAYAAGLPGARLSRDRFGNRAIRIRKGDPTFAPIAFVAHTDHPGFVVDRIEEGGRRVHARFEGHVEDTYFNTAGVRLFRHPADAGIAAHLVAIGPRDPGVARNRTALLEAEEDATGALLGMWDLAPFRVREGLLESRACDDLAGVAMILEALRRVAEDSIPADISGVFTRAEETGFRGAIALARHADEHDLLGRDAVAISVETSSQRPHAPVGGGAILRVGDRTSVFDPETTAALREVSDEAARRDGRRELRRALMDGGSCEATVFVAMGWRSGGVCVPLGNYHNMNADAKRIDTEFVSVADCEDLVGAMARLGQTGVVPGRSRATLLKNFHDMADMAEPVLAAR
jgi:endoglucanase